MSGQIITVDLIRRTIEARDQGYEPLDSSMMSRRTAGLIEAIMVEGVKMKDAAGLAKPFNIPPRVALAILRMLTERGELR